MNRTQNQAQVRRGAMMVEAALVLPVLFLLVFGIIEYGWMFLKSHEISLAARDGARAGSLSGGTTGDVTSAINTRLTQAGIPSGQFAVAVAPAPETLDRGQTFTVTINVNYGQSGGLSVLNIPIIPVPDQLKSKFTMAKEGP